MGGWVSCESEALQYARTTVRQQIAENHKEIMRAEAAMARRNERLIIKENSEPKPSTNISKTNPSDLETTETNWCNMPEDIMLKLIDLMDFKTRYLLRGTAHKERGLVDSLGYKFDEIILRDENLEMRRTFWKKGFTQINESYFIDLLWSFQNDNLEKIIPLLGYILNNCQIDHFNRYSKNQKIDQNHLESIDKLIKPESIRIKEFYSENIGFSMIFLPKLWCHVEYIQLYLKNEPVEIEKLFEIPVVKTGLLNIFNPVDFQILHFVQKWIEYDVQIGTEINTVALTPDVILRMEQRFQNRIIINNAKHLRLQTNNPEKHISIGKRDAPYIMVIPHYFHSFDNYS